MYKSKFQNPDSLSYNTSNQPQSKMMNDTKNNYRKAFNPNELIKTSKPDVKEVSVRLTPNGLINKFAIPFKKDNQSYSKKDLDEAKNSIQGILLKIKEIKSKPSSAITQKNSYQEPFEMDKAEIMQKTFFREHDGINDNYVKMKPKPNISNSNNPIDIMPSKGKLKEKIIEPVSNKQFNNKVNKEGNKFESKINYDEEEDEDNNIDDLDNRPAFSKVKGNAIYKEAETSDNDYEEKQQCPHCGRSFKEEAYNKHVNICKDVFIKKRKAFNTKEMRLVDEQKEILNHNKIMEKKEKGKKQLETKKSTKNNWKAKSEEFRRAMQGDQPTNNNVEIYVKAANNQQNNTPTPTYSDLQLCNLCGRKYNESAYTKHLPTCQNKAKVSALKNKK